MHLFLCFFAFLLYYLSSHVQAQKMKMIKKSGMSLIVLRLVILI